MTRWIVCVTLLLESICSVSGVTQNQTHPTPTPTPTPTATPTPTPSPTPGSSPGYKKNPLAGPDSPMKGDVEILSDTHGVDFGPYLQHVLYGIRIHWYNLIPDVAKPPVLKSGTLIIKFAILKDGKVAGMVLERPSGDVYLDRAAWGGITASDPFEHLPAEFSGAYLMLRIRFVYNPKSDSATPDSAPPTQK